MDHNLDHRHVLKKLGKIEFLRRLPAEEVHQLVPHISHQVFKAGSVLIEQGDQGDAIYFIEKGVATVSKDDSSKSWEIGAGSVVGEISLVTGELRSASVKAKTDLSVWKIERNDFQTVIEKSPKLKTALDELAQLRKSGRPEPRMGSASAWTGVALRALEARKIGLKGWQIAMIIGMIGWLWLAVDEHFQLSNLNFQSVPVAFMKLLSGFLILQGACEALITGAERTGARLKWDGFISGTIGSILSTLPEFVVIGFLVRVEPVMAVITAIVTIFNNSLAYSFYAFFLPKDRDGAYRMPRSLTVAGGEILIAGASIALILGLVMLVMKIGKAGEVLAGWDLIVVALVLLAIYIYYITTLVRYYREGSDNPDSLPPDPDELGYDYRLPKIVMTFIVGIVGSYCGGEAIGEFADIVLKETDIGKIATSAILAFFAGMSEYIIVYKSHRRGELGIALSNVFGGMTQVMFLLLPFGLLLIGLLHFSHPGGAYALPINAAMLLLILLLYPLFHTLHQYLKQENRISNLGAAGMSGIYLLLLYFLFSFPNS